MRISAEVVLRYVWALCTPYCCGGVLYAVCCMLYCYIAILLYCYIAILLYCYIAILLYCYIAVCYIAVLPYCNTILLYCHIAPLYCCIAPPYCARIHPPPLTAHTRLVRNFSWVYRYHSFTTAHYRCTLGNKDRLTRWSD